MNTFKQTALAAALAALSTTALAANFAELDANKDQQLTAEELQAFSTERGETAEQTLSRFDGDDDASLDEAEFERLNAQQPMTASAGGAASTQAEVEKTTITVNQKPAKVTVSNTAPTIKVYQPEPQVSITQRDPVVNVQQAEPQVNVQQADPTVNVDQAQPTVAVDQPEPRVQVDQNQPDIQVQQQQPQVNVAQPMVQTEPAQPPADADSQWAKTSVAELQSQQIYNADGELLGNVIDVVEHQDQQQAGLLVGVADKVEVQFVRLGDIVAKGGKLHVNSADAAKPIGELQDLDISEFKTVTDQSRTVKSLLSDQVS